jgi:predicted dienelactone hydrolase
LADGAFAEQTGKYRAGYTTLGMDSYDAEGMKVRVDVALWYPSTTGERPFQYDYSENKVSTGLAVNGKPAVGKFPLVVYSHGAAGCGLSMAFLTERLAREGFVVAGPDYKDRYHVCQSSGTAPALRPRHKLGMLIWTQELREYQLNKGGKAFRQKLAYRPKQAQAVIDLLLNENRNRQSPLYGTINEQEIGLVGHSFGAWTSMLLGGADPAFRDARVKAIAPLSGPVNDYVYERDEVGNIKIPVMFMFGGDEPKAGRASDQDLLYDRAHPPKFLLEIKRANHLTFSGGIRPEFQTTSDYVEKDSRRAAMVDYIVAFFKYYLQKDISAKKQLTVKDNPHVSGKMDFGQ